VQRARWALLAGGITLAACGSASAGRPVLTEVTLPVPTTLAPVATTAPTVEDTTPPPDTMSPDTTAVPSETLVLGFGGDVLLNRGMTDPFGGVADLVTAPQLMIVNLETTIAEPEVGVPPIEKEFLFKSPPAAAAQLRDGGIDVAALANNHIWDFGDAATIRTVELLDEAGVARVGAGTTAETADDPLVLEAAGRRVGILSYSRVPCDWAGSSGSTARALIAWACDPFLDRTDAAVARMVAETDVVVVMLHGGDELALCQTPAIRSTVERWIGAGADIVVVSHPHVLNGAERIGDGVVLWSTGNFVFPNRGGETGRSAVFHVLVDGPLGPERTLEVVAHPVVLPGGRPQHPDEAGVARILADLSDRSVGFRFDESRRMVPDPAPSICDNGATATAADVAPRTSTTTTTTVAPS
jgi:poly-gamma-glutamate capsule biosynthesis protein CapA/YwtB (metallophosphatase superfamily)